MTSQTTLHNTPSTSDRINDEHLTTIDVLSNSDGSSHASLELSSRPRVLNPGPGSNPSPFAASSAGMSRNPSYEVAESLRSLDTPISVRSRSTSYESRFDMEQEMDSEQHTADQDRQRSAAKMDGLLPADDGMQSLRQQLLQIKQLAISTEEKAKQMHELMTRDYMAHRVDSTSPLSLYASDSKSLYDEPAALDVGLAAMPIDPRNPYSIRPGDLDRTYSPLPALPDRDPEDSMEVEERPALGCMHYMRNVKVQCFDCHRWFPCRHCHDQSQDLPFLHGLRRKMTRNMLCMLCRTPQPAAEICENCEEYAAYYFCPKCKLWDNDSNKSIYHCDDCGICRLGEGLGKDFVHCKKCNVCISISTSAAHPCIEGATEGDCPLCLDGMFASRSRVVSLPCGHYMHGSCYKDLMAVTYKCPVCSKSAVNMELQWRKLDDEIFAQPMPDDDEELNNLLPHMEDHAALATDDSEDSPTVPPRRPKTVWIGCNDCGSRCWTPFHWLGLKCQLCGGFNTNQMAPTAERTETETERLIRQQQIHRHHDFTGNAVLRDIGVGADDNSRPDSALYVPSSPSQLAVPVSPGSPGSSSSGLPSPRRYFVQDEEPRRPSFNSARFSTPTLPTLPNLPEMPRLPRMPNMPAIPNMPNMPNYMPTMPNLPNMPVLPNMPNMPNMPELGLPRFSAYDMFDSLSRSLSPMRYYLQGLDVQDEQLRRDANRSPTSIHSDPTANESASKHRNSDAFPDNDAVGFWGSDGHFLSGEEDDDDAESDHPVKQAEDDDDDDDDDEEESTSDSSDASDGEMIDDDLDGGDDDEDMELFGHR